MTNKNIVKRLRDEAERIRGDDRHSFLLDEAADEIEYLRQRCEQIDQEWRTTIDGQKEPYGRRF